MAFALVQVTEAGQRLDHLEPLEVRQELVDVVEELGRLRAPGAPAELLAVEGLEYKQSTGTEALDAARVGDRPDRLGQVAVDRHDQVEGPWLDPVVCQVRADRGDRDTPRLGETSGLREPNRRQVDRGNPEASLREMDPVPSVAVAQRERVPSVGSRCRFMVSHWQGASPKIYSGTS